MNRVGIILVTTFGMLAALGTEARAQIEPRQSATNEITFSGSWSIYAGDGAGDADDYWLIFFRSLGPPVTKNEDEDKINGLGDYRVIEPGLWRMQFTHEDEPQNCEPLNCNKIIIRYLTRDLTVAGRWYLGLRTPDLDPDNDLTLRLDYIDTGGGGVPTFTLSPTSWQAPSSGGSQVITITSRVVDAPWTATTSATWLTLSASAGIGSGTVTLTAAPRPGGVRTATALIGDNIVTVTQGGVITDLRVVRVDGNLVTLRWSWDDPSRPSFVVVGGLEPGQRLATLMTGSTDTIVQFTAPLGVFYVRVYTADDVTFERPSNEVPLIVTALVPPSPPTNLLATVNGDRLDLAWTNTFRGGPPSGVRIQVSGAVNASLSLPLGEQASFASVPAGSYTVAVVATNLGGASAPSFSVTLPFPSPCSGPPLTPVKFLAYLVGRTVSVIWETAPGGPAPTDFLVNVAPLGLSLSTGGSRRLSGAVPPGTYTLSVVARNVCGVSGPTVAQTVIVP